MIIGQSPSFLMRRRSAYCCFTHTHWSRQEIIQYFNRIGSTSFPCIKSAYCCVATGNASIWHFIDGELWDGRNWQQALLITPRLFWDQCASSLWPSAHPSPRPPLTVSLLSVLHAHQLCLWHFTVEQTFLFIKREVWIRAQTFLYIRLLPWLFSLARWIPGEGSLWWSCYIKQFKWKERVDFTHVLGRGYLGRLFRPDWRAHGLEISIHLSCFDLTLALLESIKCILKGK